jgi:hypothetical protein
LYTKKNLLEILVIIFCLSFSYWLFFSTFSYRNHTFFISTKLWSDFASHIPLIRSFSLGDNFPPEYPMFPGEPIRYHFFFYFLVGLLERVGIPINIALNGLSALSFFMLLILIYALGRDTFKKKSVGVIALFLFLCNGSFSFLEFFKTHPLSKHSLTEIVTNTTFPSFGPYDGKIVSAFWHLNIYTNQRHLALSFAIPLLIIYLLYIRWDKETRWVKKSFYISLLSGLLLFVNQATFLIALLWIAWFIILHPRRRIGLLFGALYGIPIVFLFTRVVQTSTFFLVKPGFLINPPLTIPAFINYWVYNFGFVFVLLPLAMIISKKKALLHLVPLLILFTIPNIFQLSRDIINNHKFFNFFYLVAVIYIANLLVLLWSTKKILGVFTKTLAILLFFFLTLSGFIELMAIKNDYQITLNDYLTNPDVTYFVKNTPKDTIILNSTFLYHPASLAGRKVFYGYPYFAWSYGYDTTKREQIYLAIYQAQTKKVACKLLQLNNISYVELNNHPEEFIHPNIALFDTNFVKVYSNPITDFRVFNVASSCKVVK